MEHIKDNSLKSTRTWRACGYVRLSHEDGDKEESNSITGQKNLIAIFLAATLNLRSAAWQWTTVFQAPALNARHSGK